MLQYCTFWVGDLFIGIEVSKVQEVLRHGSITPVPLAPDYVKGLINLRGHIVTAIDMGLRLGVETNSTDGEMMHVILSDDQGLVSLVIDRAGDVVEVDREQEYEDPPDTLQGEARRLIRGAFKLEGRLLLDLDVDYAVMRPE